MSRTPMRIVDLEAIAFEADASRWRRVGLVVLSGVWKNFGADGALYSIQIVSRRLLGSPKCERKCHGNQTALSGQILADFREQSRP